MAHRGGRIAAILGASGSGKTTLIRAFAGLLPSHSGSILIDGHGPEEARRKGYISVVFQQPVLLPWLSAGDNMEFACLGPDGKATDPGGLRTATRRTSLLDQLLLPKAVTELLPYQLSGGMSARVALAGALLAGRPVMLLDEPFAPLDEQAKRACYEALLEHVHEKDVACILVTHNIVEALFLSDDIIVLSVGDAGATVSLRLANEMKGVHQENADAAAFQASYRTLLEAYG